MLTMDLPVHISRISSILEISISILTRNYKMSTSRIGSPLKANEVASTNMNSENSGLYIPLQIDRLSLFLNVFRAKSVAKM